MTISIFTNVSSLNSQRFLDLNISRLGKSIQKVASGNRILTGSDDVAGLAISEALRSDIRTLRQAVRNTNDGVALLNVTEGALNVQSGILIRLRELASQAASGAIGDTSRRTLQLEFQALSNEIDRIALTTEFNGITLLDGSLSSSARSSDQFNIQVGLNSNSENRINLNREIALEESTASGLGIGRSTIVTATDALNAMDALENALDSLSQSRGKVGAVQNQLQRTQDNLNALVENLVAADSTIRDADIAEEIALLTRNQIITQASVAMISQTNIQAENLIQFLSGV